MNDFNAKRNTVNVLGVVGSLRRNSFNLSLLRTAVNLFPKWLKFETFDISQIPHYNQDVEDAEIPEIVREFKEKVRDADAVLIATPEYNGSVSGVLKDALDWASRPYGDSSFEGKPVGILTAVAGRRGGRSVLNHLTLIVEYLDAKMVGEPVLVQLAPQKFDGQGNLSDPEALSEIKQLIADLVKVLPSRIEIANLGGAPGREERQVLELTEACCSNGAKAI